MTQGRALTMDGDIWDWLKVAGAAGAGIGGGVSITAATLFFLRWMFNYIAGRTDANAKMASEAIATLIAAQQAQIAAQQGQLTAAFDRLDTVEKKLVECNEKHAKSEGEMAMLRAQLEIKGVIAQEAQKANAADALARREREE